MQPWPMSPLTRDARDAIFRHIDEHLPSHVAELQRWVRQKSVSWDDGEDVATCADLVAESFRAVGCEQVEVIPGRFHPGVWAHLDQGASVTLHAYAMFDTRTVEAKRWSRNPWSGDVIAHPKYPKVLHGRGAFGAKGPFVAWLRTLASIQAVMGTLPVNVAFLAEGEEIMGSPSYRAFVERYAPALSRVQASFNPGSAQSPSNGRVTLGLGLKGMIVVELSAEGGRWPGAPAQSIHSSAAGLVHAPAFRLAQALATLTQPDGSGCAIDGLADAWAYRAPLSADQERLLRDLAAANAGRDWRDVLPVGGRANVTSTAADADAFALLQQFLYGPTLNIAGLRSGFLGRGTGTIPFITPGSATATLDLRWVVPMPPEEILAALRRHLDARGFHDVHLDVLAAFTHHQTNVAEPLIQSTLRTLRAWGYDADVWPIQAGGGPWTVVPDRFGVPCLRGGAPGFGTGGDDEFLVIEGDGNAAGLADVMKFHVDALFAAAEALAGAAGR
jgi:acetylornithine deacetylase/succinyl-diaminopimelate desuccinylase-like protein